MLGPPMGHSQNGQKGTKTEIVSWYKLRILNSSRSSNYSLIIGSTLSQPVKIPSAIPLWPLAGTGIFKPPMRPPKNGQKVTKTWHELKFLDSELVN